MGHRMLKETNKLFCIFCGDEDLKTKQAAVHHYLNHIRNKPTSPIADNKISPTSNQITDFAKDWTSNFIDSLEEENKKCGQWKGQFRNCPVCSKTTLNKMIQSPKARKSSSEKDHMRAHLKYRKFMCKICSRDNNIPYPKNQLVAFHDGPKSKNDLTVHRIKSSDRVNSFNTCKATKKSVLKHIHDVHLGPEISTVDCDRAIDVDQLVIEFEIYAVEELINACSGTTLNIPSKNTSGKKPLKAKKSKELVIINSDESQNSFKMKIEPMNAEVLAQGRNSLLKPNFNFSPILERKKISKKNSRIKAGVLCKRQLLPPIGNSLSLLNDHNYCINHDHSLKDNELDNLLEDYLDKEQELTNKSVRRSYSRYRTIPSALKVKPSSYSSILDTITFRDDLEYFKINDDVLNEFTSELMMSNDLKELKDIDELLNCD